MFKDKTGRTVPYLTLKRGETKSKGAARLRGYGWEVPDDVIKLDRLIFTNDTSIDEANSFVKSWNSEREGENEVSPGIEADKTKKV